MIDIAATRATAIRYWREHKSKDARGQQPLFEAPRTAGGKIGQDMDSTRQWTAEDSAQHPRDNRGQFRQKPGGDPNQAKLFDPESESAKPMTPEEIRKPPAAPAAKPRGFDVQKGLLDEAQPKPIAEPQPLKPATAPAPRPQSTHLAEIKKQVGPETLVLFRAGDFYEAFGPDAQLLNKHLGVSLTTRPDKQDEYRHLAGFPRENLEAYLKRLVDAGQRVAISEMVKPGEQPHAKADVAKVKAVKQRQSPKVEKAIEKAAKVLTETSETTKEGLVPSRDKASIARAFAETQKRDESRRVKQAIEKAAEALSASLSPAASEKEPTKEPWQMTRQEHRYAEIKPQFDAIQAALKSGKPITLTTHLRSTRFTKPEHFRLGSAGNVYVPEGKRWVSLTDQQVESLAVNQAGMKFVPFDERVYHRMAVEDALASGKPVPPEVLAEYPDLLGKAKSATDTERQRLIQKAKKAKQKFGSTDAEKRIVEINNETEQQRQAGMSLDQKYAEYIATMKASGITPRGKDEWTASVQAKHSPKFAAAIEEAAFTLSGAPQKPIHKPAEFENAGGKQKKLLSGLNALPGQMDLIGDLDKQGEGEPKADAPAEHSSAVQSTIEQAAEHIAATSRDSAIDQGASPREAADQAATTQASQYEFARESAIPNAGEDLKGSARHKVNAWRSLADAEANGTAEQLVHRDTLLKAEPPDLMQHVEKNPLTALAMHLAMKRFPAKPGYGTARRRSKLDEEMAKKDRQQYVDAYHELKATAEKIAASENDPVAAFKQFGGKVQELVRKYRGAYAESGYMANLGTDQYNNTANSLVALAAAVSTSGRELRKSTNLARAMTDFATKVRQHPDYEAMPSQDRLARVVQHVQDAMEGKSLSSIFGDPKSGGGPKRFDPAELYVAKATRKGGQNLDAKTSTPAAATKYMTDELGLRGVQWGNSVTDSEREHHSRMAAEALADLTDVLALDPRAISLDGKLGLAIGARGHGNALAHYEPTTQVINLTRTGGVGSLAHEWGHAFDHSLTDYKISGRLDKGPAPDFQSDRISPKRLRLDDKGQVMVDEKRHAISDDLTNDPIWSTFDALRKSWQLSGFRKRLSETVSQMIRDGRISQQKRAYWTSNEEVFARTFERYIQRKLASSDRANTYLAGIESKAYKEGGLWPTDQEVDAMTPAFDAIFAAYRQQRGSQPQRYTREQLTAWFMRYMRQPGRPSQAPQPQRMLTQPAPLA